MFLTIVAALAGSWSLRAVWRLVVAGRVEVDNSNPCPLQPILKGAPTPLRDWTKVSYTTTSMARQPSQHSTMQSAFRRRFLVILRNVRWRFTIAVALTTSLAHSFARSKTPEIA